MNTLNTYLPQDRLRALTRGESLPDRTSGAALFADISGFTPLTETLRELLGSRRGAEELTKHLDAAYTGLIAEVERYGGSVIDFAGDAITCWFDDEHGTASPRATACAFALQEVMRAFRSIALPNGTTTALTLKVTVASGPARRFVVGDPTIHYLDALAGATVARTSVAEHLAQRGEILLDEVTVNRLEPALTIYEWRAPSDAERNERFAVVTHFDSESAAQIPSVSLPPLPADELQVWIHHTVYEREQSSQDTFLPEFRPCMALFVRFMGIDYDSNEAEKQLDAFLRSTQTVVERYEGTLLQITIGDKGSYAYINFGVLAVHEDEARRAVKAALDLKKAAEGLGFLAPLQIGLTQGTLRVGAYGGKTRRTYGALGDEVNLAARLMMTAAPGEILISSRVRKTIAEEFIVEARPPMTLKGKAELLPVFAVLGIAQQRAIRLQEPAYTLPMIGRGRELALLSEKLDSVLHGRGQIIGVTGEAGMGKSRLVAEGIRLARRSRLVGYGGACQSDGTNTPYLVWRAIWNAFFDLDPSSSQRKQIRSLEGELEDQAPEHVDALPLLGTALGLPLPENDFTRLLQPKDRKAQLETVLIKCLESAAREMADEGSGLLLVLEDLHWIDAVSFDLLELVGQAIEKLPVLILLTYRPSDTGSEGHADRRLAALNHFTKIRLTELNATETEQAIRSKLFSLFPEQSGAVPRLLIERITSRAQGNPFYVEELLNYMHDRGIDPRNIAALNELDLPTSLSSLILSRIDKLTSSQQLTIKVASIIGRVFRVVDLYHYFPSLGSFENLKADLHELEGIDLTPLESPEPDLTYLFKHLVTHEVGYESLAFATRAQLHGQYARYLEGAYPGQIDQLASQLAYHFERAQIPDRACFYLAKAGEQAAANYANEEALTYFNRALKLTTTENIRTYFDILLKRERVYDLLGKRTEQRRDLDELIQLAGQFDDARFMHAQIAIRQSKFEIDAGDYIAAKSSAQAAFREVEAESHPDLLVDALLLEARVMFLSGQAVAAKPQLDHALALARTHHYVRGEYNALAQLGLWNWYGGDNVGAAALMEQSLEIIRRAGDIRRELEILNNLGIVTKDMYKFTEAIGYYERAQKIAKKIGDRSGEASLLTNMGRACLVSGDYVQADAYCAKAAALAADVREPTTQGLALHNRSESYRELGQYLSAKHAAEESLVLLRSAGYRVGEANTLENLAVVEFSLGKRPQALELAQSALTIAREVTARRVEVSILTRIGLMQLEMGQLKAAEEAFVAAMNIEQELKESIPMFELQAGLAGVALAHGEIESSETAQVHIQELADEVLRDPPTEQSHILPMGLYLMCIRVMKARNDPSTAQMITRANEELQLRLAKITDASLRSAYMNIPEHRDITNFASALTSET